MMKDKKTLVLALIACFLWGSAFPTVKNLYTLLGVGDDYGVKMLLAGIRFTMAGVVILLPYHVYRRQAPLRGDQGFWGKVFLLALFQTTFMYAFYYIGIYNTTGVKTSVISQSSIFVIVIAAHFIYKNEPMHLGKVVGLILGLLGILTVNLTMDGGTSGFFSFQIQGEGFMLISNIFAAASTFMAKGMGRKYNPILINGWQLLIGGLLLSLVGGVTAEEVLVFDTAQTIALLFYAVIISACAFSLWYYLLQDNKASDLSVIRFTIPIFGAIMSRFFIPGEELTPIIVMSISLVALGIWFSNRPTLRVKAADQA